MDDLIITMIICSVVAVLCICAIPIIVHFSVKKQNDPNRKNNSEKANNVVGWIATVVIFIILWFVVADCENCSCFGSSDYSSFHEKEVEKTKNELYHKGSDGLWYPN